jgi:hypothetical protein
MCFSFRTTINKNIHLIKNKIIMIFSSFRRFFLTLLISSLFIVTLKGINNNNLEFYYPQNKSGEIGNDFLGFKFSPPEGWTYQVTNEGIILGSNTVPGIILVLPSQAQSLTQMKQEMSQGIQDYNASLNLSGKIGSYGKNSLIADYKGTVEGASVVAKGIGILSKDGNGAYILAASSPEVYSAELLNTAKTIASRINFTNYNEKGKSVNQPELIKAFTGKWSTATKNTTTDIYLYPNGIYSENYEAAYLGNLYDGTGNNTGSWGTENQSSETGKWSVKGNKDSGYITIIFPDGKKTKIKYQVHVEKGNKYYNEYYFDGILYWKTPIGN